VKIVRTAQRPHTEDHEHQERSSRAQNHPDRRGKRGVDPVTVIRFFKGETVRPLSETRIRRALATMQLDANAAPIMANPTPPITANPGVATLVSAGFQVSP
jgi:hypothetical protein